MALSIPLLVLSIALLATAQTPTDFSPYTASPLIVQYPGSAPFKSGVELQPKEPYFLTYRLTSKPGTQVVPSLFLPSSSQASTAKYYTIIAIDPDAPSRTNTSLANVLHWLQPSFHISTSSNVTYPANTTLLPLVSSAKPFSTYIGPAPGAGSGPHRYIFFLYEQSSASYDLPAIYEGLGQGEGRTKNITKFDLEAYVQRVGLNGPVAGTYFTVENKTGTANGTGSTIGGANATNTGAIGGSGGASGNASPIATVTAGEGATGSTGSVLPSAAGGGESVATSANSPLSASAGTAETTGVSVGGQASATSTAQGTETVTPATSNAGELRLGLAIVAGLLGCLVAVVI
ncbi:uncharacterized protein KY384_005116 [Bacidia gigantensis]|uniref:uncharacterized protein n=1 Tax=Bacidia gigantensis TaxID=2732470 RepID=UPI001D0444AD|nr:uncharacterized protein KY384_005116 [Bacidia gigantensis]KAG8529636.1 hypothetical protein KY384_005116 [Bacidia gigantensis]